MRSLTILISCIVVASLLFLFVFNQKTEDRSDQPTKLRFVSLAWQEQALATNHSIVDEWNALHPEIQVDYVQGSWNSIYDYLITSFETGDVPDVFHYESGIIVDFAVRGYLTNLAPMLSDDTKHDILDIAWSSVTRSNGEVVGIPFLIESLVTLYNRDAFEQARIVAPTASNPWTWDELMSNAKHLTKDIDGDGNIDQWGVGIGLRSSANIIMNLSISFGGSYFYRENNSYVVRVGEPERKLLNVIHRSLYYDNSAAPSSIGQTGANMLPGFMSGKFAMLVGIGAWARQQLVENAPKSFRWGVIPPLKAENQNTGISTQTLSIPKKSKRQKEAMAFIEFMLNSQNAARLAKSDWMLPARKSCLAMKEFNTSPDGWDVVTNGVRFLKTGSWLGVPGYVEWKSRVVNPMLQELFANRLSVDEAARRIEVESNIVLQRHQMRDPQW